MGASIEMLGPTLLRSALWARGSVTERIEYPGSDPWYSIRAGVWPSSVVMGGRPGPSP